MIKIFSFEIIFKFGKNFIAKTVYSPPRHVLDFGCGYCTFSGALHPMSPKTVSCWKWFEK